VTPVRLSDVERSRRDPLVQGLAGPWDLLVIGGGITGAGLLREAAARGYRALLVEQRDFAWGTSSRSSKLVHGGLRYLKQAQLKLTWESVRERDRLLLENPGLVTPLGFLLATYAGDFPGPLSYAAGLAVYDAIGLRWRHRHLGKAELRRLTPLGEAGLTGGFRYEDAQTDDARLVLRTLQEAVADGGVALNHARVESLVMEGGAVAGAAVRDVPTGNVTKVLARVVINATGVWADELRTELGHASRLRPLRGSHLVFPAARVPVKEAVSILHPRDRRPVFVFPWEGATVVGTTDVDHTRPLAEEPAITAPEAAYLLEAISARMPSLALTGRDAIASFAGVRPVVGTGKADPSKESRDHVLWQEDGLLTVTGGKLTTFVLIARQALAAVARHLPAPKPRPAPPASSATGDARLAGRYGASAEDVARGRTPAGAPAVPGHPTLWQEIRWGARAESVLHLDDLLLRRVRIGLLTPDGGAELLPWVQTICREVLGWDDARWADERDRYLELWRTAYAPPPAPPAGPAAS